MIPKVPEVLGVLHSWLEAGNELYKAWRRDRVLDRTYRVRFYPAGWQQGNAEQVANATRAIAGLTPSYNSDRMKIFEITVRNRGLEVVFESSPARLFEDIERISQAIGEQQSPWHNMGEVQP